MRRAARVDCNHGEVIKALRAVGCSVQDLSAVGKGCPDLLVAVASRTLLIEVKRPKAKGQRAGELTADQVRWLDRWPGEVHVVDNAEAAIKAVGL